MTETDLEFAQDLLRGAEEIAQFLYGDRELRRKVYHLVATSNLAGLDDLCAEIGAS